MARGEEGLGGAGDVGTIIIASTTKRIRKHIEIKNVLTQIRLSLSSKLSWLLQMVVVTAEELPGALYLFFCFFLRRHNDTRHMSINVSDTSWSPGGGKEAFSAPLRFMETQRLNFTLPYFWILICSVIFKSNSSCPPPSFFFFFRLCVLPLSPSGNVGRLQPHKMLSWSFFQKLLD